METREWWDLIESARSACGERAGDRDPADDPLPDAVLDRVTALPPEQIIGFARRLSAVFDSAYLAPLWAAAYVIEGGCGDDGFMDFRSGLMLQGRAVFEAPSPIRTRSPTCRWCAGWPAPARAGSAVRRCWYWPGSRISGGWGRRRAMTRRSTARQRPARARRRAMGVEDAVETRRRLPRLAALFLAP